MTGAAQKLAERMVPPVGPIACGVDLVELVPFSRDLRLGGQRFLQRIYTDAEIAFCAGRVDRLAARFAAKEAIAKALGTGIRSIGWAAVMGLEHWAVSLSHSKVFAIAYVVAAGRSE